ncbi:unnamed protein product [Staurois parvus]|uniref:Uncharacterized protein n=1 Tax=Staurois parvus TaxID=386267 RepID=A0ABN9AM63_9NEOB|nr:unnamed protein product [Staurois parvus]
MVGMDLVQGWNQVAPLGTPGGGRGVLLRVCARDEPAAKGTTDPDPSGMDGCQLGVSEVRLAGSVLCGSVVQGE